MKILIISLNRGTSEHIQTHIHTCICIHHDHWDMPNNRDLIEQLEWLPTDALGNQNNQNATAKASPKLPSWSPAAPVHAHFSAAVVIYSFSCSKNPSIHHAVNSQGNHSDFVMQLQRINSGQHTPSFYIISCLIVHKFLTITFWVFNF